MTDHCGYIALIGRTNVGKSTLLNELIGSTIAITCHKSHTTRTRILGILTEDQYQMVFIDSPGLGEKTSNALQRKMMRTTDHCIAEADIIVFMTDCYPLSKADHAILKKLDKENKPTLVLFNKIDRMDGPIDYETLADLPECVKSVLPISASKGIHIDLLIAQLRLNLPERPYVFGTQEQSDQPLETQYAEFIREQILLQCHAEVPHTTHVAIEQAKRMGKVMHIDALITVQTPGQKGIIIGKQGQQLKSIGQRARKRIEYLIDSKVMLKLWVKVDPAWMQRNDHHE